MRQQIQKFGRALSGMVMPNIGAFIAWGFVTALFIPSGWWPNAQMARLVDPMLTYLLPLLIAYTAGRNVAGERGGVIGAIAAMGVIVGSDIPMFIGAMVMGPLGGYTIRWFGKLTQGRIKAGFEMLVSNFSIGILGMLLAILGYWVIGGAVTGLTLLVSNGVEVVIRHGLLPLVSLLVEPSKVLFLNNALNHGIFSPIGIEQARETGQSIMFLLETNPGPGLGVLLACWFFGRGNMRQSAPGAVIIQFFGGIHEIYFPYILARPALILAPVAGSAAGLLFFSLAGAGLVAPASPGSIISVLAMAPKGQTLVVLAGVLISTAVSLLMAAPFVRRAAAATAAAGDPVAEAGRFHAALERAKAELSALAEGEAVFAAHLEMAGDPMLAGLVEGRIAEKHLSAEQALGEACEEVCGMFAALDDDYLRGRTDDVRDVCARIGRILSGETAHDPFAGLAPGTIVVADELAPSDTAQMDFGRVAGLVTAHGSVTSHVAIIARNKGIAALVGVAGCMRQVRTGDRLIIDGERGELIVDPDPATGRKYAARLESLRQDAFRCAADAQAPAVTPAGRRITVLGNAASVDEVRRALDAGAEGIGLFRSEFLYMQGPALPDEETQFAAYRAAAELCGARPLTVRTLDIGGDKALPYMHFEPEENPFLGWRAIRVSLAMPELFRTQLRALLRASAFGNVRVMFPMVASVGEFRAAKAVVEACMAELDAEGTAYDRSMALGVMIETPAAVFIAGELAAEAQFFSIGTNDLTQYVMAADRGNPRVAYLCDPFDPAVQRSIGMVLDAAHRAGIEAGMCGELAADPRATQRLVALGLGEFSVGPPAIAPLKHRIRTDK